MRYLIADSLDDEVLKAITRWHPKAVTQPGIYLHGSLEQKAGFDIVMADSPGDSLIGLYGVYPVKVRFENGPETVEAVAFVWPDKNHPTAWGRGLVVASDDVDAIEGAMAKFKERKQSL